MLKQTSLLGLPLYLVSGLLAATPTLAQDFIIYGGASLEYVAKNDSAPSSLTSEAYLELEYKGLYGGIVATNSDADFADDMDIYIGYRGEAGQLSYDAYIDYNVLTETGTDDDYVELAVIFGYAVSESFSLGAEFYHYPETSQGGHYVTAAYSISDTLGIDASVGRYDDWAGDWYNEWEVGTTYYFGEGGSVDLRYYDGQGVDGSFGLTLAWDSTIFGG